MANYIEATKTLALIDEMIEQDQGAKFREILGTIMPKMDDAYRGESSPYRSHLGVSLIGKECARELWYGFRWVSKPKFDARTLRLFNRGHLEEARFLAMLQMIDCDLWYETEEGGQFRVSYHGGHMGSALDGIVRKVPDLPPELPAYAEFKTSATKAFRQVHDFGAKEEKWQHYVQMQVCMNSYQLPYALYMMVQKDTDALHAEIIPYDKDIAERYIERGREIIFTPDPPLKINESPTFFKCKFCDKKDICHKGALPDQNCRTCRHSQPMENGSWRCNAFNQTLPNPKVDPHMYKGCEYHEYIPALVE